MECKFCKKILSTIGALRVHQKRTAKCLKLQGIEKKGDFECKLCGKDFNIKLHLHNHENICKRNIQNIQNTLNIVTEENDTLKSTVKDLQNTVKDITKDNERLKDDKKNLQDRYDDRAKTAVNKPTTTNIKNVKINNYIKNMPPLLDSDITNNVNNLTLEHHVKGVEGYAEYALEFPFKDKIVCVDVPRKKIKYKNSDGDLVEDVGFRKMMIKMCEAIKDRSNDLSNTHYDNLTNKFTENELKNFNYLETVIAIRKYANGIENDFCNKVIGIISKGSNK